MRVLPDPAPSAGAASVRWSDLRARVISAVILGPLVILGIWWGGVPYAAMLMAAALGLGWEWVALCGAVAPGLPGALMLMSIGAAACCTILGEAPAGLALLALGTVATGVAGREMAHARAFAAGVPYIGLGVVSLIWLRADGAVGLTNLMFVLLLVWSSDIGAYCVGRFVGGPKLAPSISPGKTWSGAAGGLLGALGAAWAVAAAFPAGGSMGRVGVIAVVLGVTSQAGDLLESQIKRHFGVKDSSRIIPGHGGLLDRLDALLLAAQVAAVLALMAGRGVKIWQ